MKIGIIREWKTPPDSRVPLIPEQCKWLQENYPLEIVVEPSPSRCFSDEEYAGNGVRLSDDLSDCDYLIGVKEVPVSKLGPDKTYLFFSHTIKRQPNNRTLLWAILDLNIRLIDYEVLKDVNGNRLIAFGRFAGMVGAHNAIWTYARRTNLFPFTRMKDCKDYEAAKAFYKTVALPAFKVVLTGTGRVASGAAQVLRDMGIRQVAPEEFLAKDFPEAVFTQLDSLHYVKRKDGKPFSKQDFYNRPQDFASTFKPWFQVADIMVNGIYWDTRSPVFFSTADMQREDFHIKVIADVTCDIVPDSSIPSTIKASTIADPVFGFDPALEKETEPFRPDAIDMMTIDNLPNELPRDASTAFGNQFIQHILPELMKEKSPVLEYATIAENGMLGKHFQYLQDYASQLPASF